MIHAHSTRDSFSRSRAADPDLVLNRQAYDKVNRRSNYSSYGVVCFSFPQPTNAQKGSVLIPVSRILLKNSFCPLSKERDVAVRRRSDF